MNVGGDWMKSIYAWQEYGHVSVHLRELMDAKQISRNQLARAIDARFEVVDKWYQGEVARIDADILARICHVLDCQVQDIITYEPAK